MKRSAYAVGVLAFAFALIAWGSYDATLAARGAVPARTVESEARQPTPPTIREVGSRVVSTRLVRRGPLIVTARHSGSSNFVVKLVGRGLNELLVNEIGQYSGQVAVAETTRGRVRLAVEADGSWIIQLNQPVPSLRRATRTPGRYSGRGSRVIRLYSGRDLQPVFTARHRGQSNFVVHLIGYGNTSGQELVFNEIGNYRGQMLVDDMSRGHYLLAVQADGSWTVSIAP